MAALKCCVAYILEGGLCITGLSECPLINHTKPSNCLTCGRDIDCKDTATSCLPIAILRDSFLVRDCANEHGGTNVILLAEPSTDVKHPMEATETPSPGPL
jgi:hypothetical protein